MIEPKAEPEKKRPNRLLSLLGSTVKAVLALLVVAAVAGGVSYGVFRYLIKSERAVADQSTASQIAALQQELRTRQDELAQKMARVEQAAAETGLLLSKNGDFTGLQTRLKEIETLRQDLQKSQADTEAKLKGLEQSLKDQLSQQSKETAQALALELKWKNLVVKAQGEVMLAQMHWAEGNRGLAKEDLTLAVKSLTDAMTAAPEPVRTTLKQAVDLGEQTRSSLILEQSSARDSLNLLWHKVGDLLALSAAN